MSNQDINRHDIIKRLLRAEINGTAAAALLSLSVRQTKRLKARVRKQGARGLIHLNRGRLSHNRLPERRRQRIVDLVSRCYLDFTPTLAAEKLAANHGLDHDPKTIRTIMIEAKVWAVRSKRNKEQHRSWRQRRAALGELVQFDGSYEHWFEERGGELCLLAAIDDATGKIMHAGLAEHEGVFPVFAFWEEYLGKHGKPMAIYLDKFSTYKMSQKAAVDNHDLLTQFQRAMSELRIETIPAHSPQAKGRVERLFGTLQDRLIKELRLANINDIETANKFLSEKFIPAFNAKFAVAPSSDNNLHRPLSIKETKQLSAILSRQSERVVHNDYTVSFKNQWYQLLKDQPVTICRKDTITVEERRDGAILFRLRGKYLRCRHLPTRPTKVPPAKQPWVLAATAAGITRRPAANHPWRLRMRANILQHQLAQV
ncbi:MAG: ISNCY family transposase [Candidatus Kerfeldbacteria bacterium]|nr:ISNCY family transposase [Candidatus Kerfeldbacteria bacterium]